jgi:hypothetical protein
MKTLIKLAAFVAAASFAAIGLATAQEKVVIERTLTNHTDWWQFHNVTPQKLSSFTKQHEARIIDIDINNTSPLRMSAALVANSGPYASGWWWYYGLTAEQISDRLTQNNARLLDIDPYMVGGELRFAVIMVPNTGAKSVTWWWYFGQTPQQLSDKLKQHKARLVDIERYRDGNNVRYATIMVSNQGAKATRWWWYYGQTAEQVTQRINEHNARLLDVEHYGKGSKSLFDIILVPNTGQSAVGWWWYYGLSGKQLLEKARQHGARLVDIEPPQDGATGYVGIMIDNGM